MPFLRFNSHRARERAIRLIRRHPQAWYARGRSTGKGGTYEVTAEEQARILAANIPGVTVPRRTDDLQKGYVLTRMRLEDVAPNHPFAQDCISFVPRPVGRP